MKKTPDLKFKYVNGMGDFIAAILHSKAVGWLTKILTGKNSPCQTCSMRRQALNVLIPLPLWRFFFKKSDDLLESLAAEYRVLGFMVEIDYEYGKISLIDPNKNEQYPN